MRKSVLIALLALALLLCGCEQAALPNGGLADTTSTAPDGTTAGIPSSGETGGAPSEEPPTESVPPATSDLPNTSYQDIVCFETEGCDTKLLHATDSQSALSVMLPPEWSYRSVSANEYAVEREGNTIGSIYYGTSPVDPEWSAVKTESRSTDDISLQLAIERNVSEEIARFRYRFDFLYDSREDGFEITLTVDYAEVSEFARMKLKSTFALENASDATGFDLVTNKKAERAILILGNSFVNSSRIGTILQEMCADNGKSLQVTAVSRGMATVATYAADAAMLADIRSGKYGALFMCGFYSNGQSDHLDAIEEACLVSGTTLVIFPAHNESADAVSYACGKHPKALLLDWKSEINALIAGGVNKWQFCIDDIHQHSTPLGGYVGAHMIYRAIFGQVPKGSVSGAITQSEVNSLLGEYVETGSLGRFDPQDRIIFG